MLFLSILSPFIRRIVCCLLLLAGSFSLESCEQENQLARRIQAHLTLQDCSEAVAESKKHLALYPQSLVLHEGYIRSLAAVGDERKMLQAWELYVQLFPHHQLNREIIEEMAWAILQKASQSSSIMMREMALLAAFFSHDTKGVTILHRGMCDNNYAVRSLAVKLASHFRDHRLTEKVKQMFFHERVWAVRQQVIESVGRMKIMSLKEELHSLVASDESTAAEKIVAIEALLELLDSIHRKEVERLCASSRSGLRQLACQSIAYFQSMGDVDQLLKLAKDPHPDVRLQAFQAIGQLRPRDQIHLIIEAASEGVQDVNYKAGLSAAWLFTLYSPCEGQQAFKKFFCDPRRDVKLAAAAALAAAGEYGLALMLEQFRSHPDPYVRLNLALGLIGQRQATQEAALYLKQMLLVQHEKWSKSKIGIFEGIINRSGKSGESCFITSESDNQLLRLELLNLLAILNTPNTQELIRHYLSERSWEISAAAAILLLTEGDDNASKVVQGLLHDDEPRIRLQAALILSLWSREENAIQSLEEGYARCEWEMKGKIVEGIGRIGAIRSIPFLIQVLKEQSQTLRLIGAMALIQCLNH